MCKCKLHHPSFPLCGLIWKVPLKTQASATSSIASLAVENVFQIGPQLQNGSSWKFLRAHRPQWKSKQGLRKQLASFVDKEVEVNKERNRESGRENCCRMLPLCQRDASGWLSKSSHKSVLSTWILNTSSANHLPCFSSVQVFYLL